jgi:hypothetical protein
MAESKKGDRSAWWLALVGALGAALGAGITGGFSYLGQKGDLDAKMIELSLGILRAKPTPETEPLREWAIAAIQKHGDFTFDDAQKKALLKQPLPFISNNAISSTISGAIQSQTPH